MINANKKVTWTTSNRIHATIDECQTLCGHQFKETESKSLTVHGILHINKKKKHCKTCFANKQNFKIPWLQ